MDHRPSIIAASAVLRAFDDQLTKEQFELKMNDVISLWGSIENVSFLVDCTFSSYYMMENVEMGKVKTVRPTTDFFNLSSTHSSLIGVIQSSSHPVAVRIKRELDFVNFANQDKKRSRKSSFSFDHENEAFLHADKRTRTGESGDHPDTSPSKLP
jgi:hypothetical protein